MKGVLLLSGGIDSPVAGYMMLRQGAELVALHMDARPAPDAAGLEKVEKLVCRLDGLLGKKTPLLAAPYAGFHEDVAKKCRAKIHCLLCKRFMYRVAEEVAAREGADFIVTGESLGQVASQTLDNLVVLSRAVEIPVIRPLIGFDKQDTVEIARKIGTFDISSMRSESCPYVPRRPSTKAKPEEVESEEGKVDVAAHVAYALSKLYKN